MRWMIHRLVLIFGLTPWLLPAQPEKSGMEQLYASIAARMEQPGGDSARFFILQQVRNHCGTDDACLYKTYNAIMIKLERRFNLPLAIFVAEEMVRVARLQNDRAAEARAYQNLGRYHGALGNNRLAFTNTEKAMRLFEQLDDQMAVASSKMAMLEWSLSYRKAADVLPEMEALLEEALQNKDSASAKHLHIRLLQHTQKLGLFDKMEEHVVALEKTPVSTPLKPSDYGNAIHAALGRADLFMLRKNYVEAERFYQKTLRLCEAEPSYWLEILVLLQLADLEWERGNPALAKSYLDKAQQNAEKLELDELLASTYARKAKMAEAEGRYADALAFTKKQQHHDEKFKARGAGFNMENYYLQQEKNRLAAEQKNQELELKIGRAQLRNALVITALVALLTLGLLVGLQKQRKARRELAAQNALIQQQTEQLKSLDAAKSRFFANVSHELRTPLTLMLGPIHTVLQDPNLSEKQTRLLRTAHQSGKGLQGLVNEILDLQKLEAGKMGLLENPTAIVPFFSRYAAQFESLAQRKEVDFSFETALDTSLVARIDQEKCRQVLYNLLSNAFKFTPAGGAVKVQLDIRDAGGPGKPVSTFPYLQIVVSDTGPGIHPDDLPQLFDRYFQTARPDKPAEGGTGIGLALCQEYAKLFGGSIEVESELGKGSVFKVAFPMKVEESLSPPAADHHFKEAAAFAALPSEIMPAIRDSSGPKPSILVVEDNPDLQDYVRLILQEKYCVLTAGNGQAALEIIQASAKGAPGGPMPVDLVLSDLMMPIMDGYQLLAKLKNSDATRHLPVIMLTARAEAGDKLQALRIGVDDYLTKPFDEEELLARIENLLANSKSRQTLAVQPGPEADSPAQEAEAGGPFVSEPDRIWLETFETYVQANIANETLSVSFLAFEFAMSESTLLRQLKRLTGLSPMQYLQEIRLDKARRLLENRSYDSIAKVADKVGYSDARSFSRSFKQRFGKLPSDFLNA
jgi:signal transduction histidine kinase/DNA-binding response OmpR family regulator